MKNAMKKLLSLTLALVLVIGVFPMATFAAENDDVATASVEDLLDSAAIKNMLEQCGEYKEAIIAKIRELGFNSPSDILQFIMQCINNNFNGFDKPEDNKPEGNEPEQTPDDNEPEQTPDDNEPAADTYDIYLNVYEIKDSTAKQWDGWNQGRAPEAMTKSEMTLSELMTYVGYGSYESVYAQVNGARYESRVPITLKDGMQIDLYVTPKAYGTRPGNTPSTPDKEPADKPTTDGNRPGRGEKVTLRVFHNDGTSNYTDITCRTTDGLLNVIEANDELSSLTRKGYKLIGWAFEANNDLNKEWIAAQHTVADDDDLRVYADWKETVPGKDEKPSKDEQGEVLLKIYVNGNTKSAAKVYDMDAYDNDGKITLAEAEKVVRKYYTEKYDDDDMDIDGLFTAKTWNDGNYSMKNAKNSISVNKTGDTIIYVMVRDAQKISSGTADSTNPKTGDTIFMTVTVMALSATALAAIYVFNKKRAVK